MADLIPSLFAGAMRPLGPAALFCLPLAALGGAIAQRRSLRLWLSLIALVLLSLFLADPRAMPRAPHLLLRATCVLGLLSLALGSRWNSLSIVAGACALASCAQLMVDVPGPLRSVLEGSWPAPPSNVVRIGLLIGSAFTLCTLAWLCSFAPSSWRRLSMILLASVFVVCASGLVSRLLSWSIANWPIPLLG